MKLLLSCLLALSTLSLDCHAARILALFPTPSRSHVIAYEALTKELASRGHQVTVVSMFPQQKPLANYTDIVLPKLQFQLNNMDLFKWKQQMGIGMFIGFAHMGNDLCDSFLSDPQVQELIHGPDNSYDLLIISHFANECVLGFHEKYKVPMVAVLPFAGLHAHFEMMGNPAPYSITPEIMLGYSDRMTFKERLLNTVTLTTFQLVKKFISEPMQDRLMRKHFDVITSEPLPYVMDIAGKTSLMFLNTHVSILYPRAYVPGVVEVGGMHLRPGGKLPEDLQKFLNEAEDGVIYFSLGSNLKSANMPADKREAFLEAFSKLKQKVLWKWEEEELPGRPENVRLGKWLPQAAILAHPNVKVFITHGGLLSMQEAVFHGVPMLAIPIFADQPVNAKRSEDMGIAVKMEFEDVTSESLNWALSTLINNPSYRERVKELSARFRDQPTTPLERAVFWTEYVIRHKGAPHLRSPALSLSWYQYFLLDVILALLLATLLLYKLIRKLMSCVCSKFCSKDNSKQKTS